MNQNLLNYIGRHQVVVAFSMNDYEQTESRGVMAGILAASKELLTPSEFDRLVATAEIDPIQLSELLALAVADPAQPQAPSSIKI